MQVNHSPNPYRISMHKICETTNPVRFDTKMPIKSTRSQAIHRSIGLFKAKDLRPCSIAEKSEFINLINKLTLVGHFQ